MTDDKLSAEELKSAIYQALGEASMAWDITPVGAFDSTRAKEIGDNLWAHIRPLLDQLEKAEAKVARWEANCSDLNLPPNMNPDRHSFDQCLRAAMVRIDSLKRERDEAVRRWEYIKTDPESARHLLSLLEAGKGTGDDFDRMMDRIIAAGNMLRPTGEDMP